MKEPVTDQIFREWVYAYSDLLYHYALRRVTDTELCKDLVQDTFLSAWRNKDAFRGQTSSKNWLFLILKRKIIDHYRKASRNETIEAINESHEDHAYFDFDGHWEKGMYPQTLTVNFDESIETREFFKVFSRCRNKLKDVQQAVFMMKYVDGLDSDEICRELEITPSNFWVIIHRAKVLLRACLEKNWINR
jgi:RNA polymerase sigma-70 factor (TIGR02943 family)